MVNGVSGEAPGLRRAKIMGMASLLKRKKMIRRRRD
jgi:hypothetical protein